MRASFAKLGSWYLRESGFAASIFVSKLLRGRGLDLFAYLTTDPKVLGILAWASAAITVLGFAVAIWQILKVKRAADAARDAALGLAQRVRSRELLAKLGDAHTHLESARNQRRQRRLADRDRWLELSSGCAIEAREISRTLGRNPTDLDRLVIEMSDLTRQLTATPDPLTADAGFILLQLELRRAPENLQRVLAQSRYDVGED